MLFIIPFANLINQMCINSTLTCQVHRYATMIIFIFYLSIIYQLNLCKTTTLKKTTKCFQDQLSLNAGQKYVRMLQVEHSAILLTFIKLPFVYKIFVLSIIEWLFYTDSTVASF